MKTQEGTATDLNVVLPPQQGNALQLGANRHPSGGLDLAHVQEKILENAAAEQAEPGQGGAGGVAEVAAGEFQRGEQRGVAALVGVLLHRLEQLAKVRTNLLRSQAAEVRADQLQ